MKYILALSSSLENVKIKEMAMSSSRNNLKSIAYNNVYLDNKWNKIFIPSVKAHKWFYCLVIVPLFYRMLFFKFVKILFLCSIVFSQDPYSLEDVNPNSITYGQNVGSSFFFGKSCPTLFWSIYLRNMHHQVWWIKWNKWWFKKYWAPSWVNWC